MSYAETTGNRTHVLHEPGAPVGGSRITNGDYLGEERNAALDCLVQQLTLGSDQPVVLYCFLERRAQDLRRARLAQEPEDTTVVDCGDRIVQIGLAGEQHPDGIRKLLPHGRQQLSPVHHRHPHVRDDHIERNRRSHYLQGLRPTLSKRQIEVTPEAPPEPFEDSQLIIDTDDTGFHRVLSSPICSARYRQSSRDESEPSATR